MDDEKRPRQTPGSGGLSGAAFAGVGIQFAVAIILFLFVGQWLDRRVGTDGVFTLIGVFVGASAAFYNMYHKITTAQKKDDEQRRS
jgi:F0F1-type ATP synthase assembly protein I